MSLPDFSTQAELFSTAGLSTTLFATTDRYRLFASMVYPRLAAARTKLEKCYCSENGRVAIEPVLMLGTSILQFLDGVPDRQAVEMLRYHAGWNFALNRQLGDEIFHPSSLVNFRNRLAEHQQSALGFTTILNALEEAGLVSRQSRQRLDSTQMLGRVARMSRLDCVRESLRLALKELEETLTPETRPLFWVGLWERYVESQADYRAGSETLARKLAESGADAWQLLQWLGEPPRAALASGPQAQLLARVFAEQFEVQTGNAAPAAKEKITVAASADTPAVVAQAPALTEVQNDPTEVPSATSKELVSPKVEESAAAAPQASPSPEINATVAGQAEVSQMPGQSAGSGVVTQPKDKKELANVRVQNPHEPEATHAVNGQGEKQKDYPGEPTAVAEPPALTEAKAHSTEAEAATNYPLASSKTQEPTAVASQPSPWPEINAKVAGQANVSQMPGQSAGSGVVIQPKDKKELASARVQNPHEPEATYAAKGQGEKKKEHVGYKVQVAETVCEAELAPGEPTRNFITGMVTHPAYEHDETGAQQMEQEQAQMGLDKPPVQYVDAAYVSAQKLAQAQAEGRELIGPALPSRQVEDRFTAADFQVNVEERKAICPAGKINTQCSRLVEQATGKASYRFEFSTQCHDCLLRDQCLGKDQRHRSLVVGEHHTVLQARRQEQRTPAFQQRMKHRNAIEGTQSELVRAHGLRHARYRGLAKVKLQNYFIGAACNVKRWIRREAWKLQQAASLLAVQNASTASN